MIAHYYRKYLTSQLVQFATKNNGLFLNLISSGMFFIFFPILKPTDTSMWAISNVEDKNSPTITPEKKGRIFSINLFHLA